MRAKYGFPFIDMHRADLQKLLHAKALELGVQIRTGARVADVDASYPSAAVSVKLESGETIQADLVVGADGLWSRCRELLLNQSDKPLPTGDLAYRIVLDLSTITDPALRRLISEPEVHFWVGPHAHAVSYSLRAGKMFNMVLLVPDDLPENVARAKGGVEEMRALFADWEPIFRKLLDQVTAVDKWKLMHRPELPRWTNDRGNFVLMGDSCHPMLPYLAQGANSAVEDGAALGRILKGLQAKEELGGRVKAWEALRKGRGEAVARQTFEQRKSFHMPDGPEQEARDALFMKWLGREEEMKGHFPSRW